MRFQFFLAFRYLRSRRKRPMARITSLAALVGVTFGVAALIVALALANGFRDEMRDKILQGTAHVTVMRKDGQAITEASTISQRLRRMDGVRDASATTYDGALLNASTSSFYAILRGVDPEARSTVEEVRRTLIDGTIDPLLSNASSETAAAATESEDEGATGAQGPDVFGQIPGEEALPPVIIGAELATRGRLETGDVATIISSDTTLTPMGLAPRYRRVRVAGVFRSGLYEYDASWIYLPLKTAVSFAGQPAGAAPVISLEVKDIYDAPQIAGRVREQLGGDFTTVDWQEANRPLFAALGLERRMAIFTIAIIILIAALNITTTLVLVVVERRADIAILSAMGAPAKSIMGVFLIEGAAIGFVGAVSGILLGTIACLAGERYKLVSLPADVYSLSSVPFHMAGRDIALAGIVAFLLSLLATIYPARIAARIRPAEALREA